MKIRMLVTVSGPRGDGSAWPERGHVADVSDVEGAHMVSGGMAVPVVDDGVEFAVMPGEENRDAIVGSDGLPDTSARDALVKTTRKPRK